MSYRKKGRNGNMKNIADQTKSTGWERRKEKVKLIKQTGALGQNE